MSTELLDGLWVAAQPIVDLFTGRIIGYETLIRGDPKSTWISPAQLFEESRKRGLEAELEEKCRSLGLSWGRRHLKDKQMLFLNIHGGYTHLPINPKGIALDPSCIALEISESHNILENPEHLECIQQWREEGYHLVLDDYGVGYAGLGLLLTVKPHIAKIDRLLIAGIDHDNMRQSMITHFAELAHDQGVALVAEGVETVDELRMLQQMGIPLAQGFFFGQPAKEPVTSPMPHIAMIPSAKSLKSWKSSSHSEPDQFSPSDYNIFRKTAEVVLATPFPAYAVTHTRHILAWNQAACALTGWTQEQMEQRQCWKQLVQHYDLHGRPISVPACPLVSTPIKDRGHKQYLSLCKADGSWLMVEVLATPLWNPMTHKTIGAIEYFWEVTSPSATYSDASVPTRVWFPINPKK